MAPACGFRQGALAVPHLPHHLVPWKSVASLKVGMACTEPVTRINYENCKLQRHQLPPQSLMCCPNTPPHNEQFPKAAHSSGYLLTDMPPKHTMLMQLTPVVPLMRLPSATSLQLRAATRYNIAAYSWLLAPFAAPLIHQF